MAKKANTRGGRDSAERPMVKNVTTLDGGEPTERPKVKRAITLGGGGPAAGLHIGVLEALAAADIEFDVWALSCIGAWVGIVYNQFGDSDDPKDKNKKVENKDRAELTYQFFKNGVFRDDEGYARFPINKVFGTDWRSNTKALNKFVANPDNYEDFAWDPYRMMDSFQESMSLFFDHMPSRDKKFKKLDEGDVNGWILNQALAPNPFVRYLTSMMYLSDVTGLAKINYPDSEFMKSIKFENLFEKRAAAGEKPETKPLIFHNAWNLDKKKLALFSNKRMNDQAYRGAINATTMCACSALPYIEQTVKIGGDTYCEGALVDTVNFHSLIEEHGDTLDEIWVSRIVDSQQVRKPKNLHDSLANLCELFAATVGEDDVKLFKYHLKEEKKWKGTVIEIHVPAHIDFKWNHENLNKGRDLGRAAAQDAIAAYGAAGAKTLAQNSEVRFINENPKKVRRVRAQADDWFKRMGVDREVLVRAILTVKRDSDPNLLAEKLNSFVDANGDPVQPNDEGEFLAGSVPYAAFAWRNVNVRNAYQELDPGPGLDKL